MKRAKKQCILIFIFILTGCISCRAQNKETETADTIQNPFGIPYFFKLEDNNFSRNYKSILDSYEQKYDIKNSFTVHEIEDIIPKTKSEFQTYYLRYQIEDSLSLLHHTTERLYHLACQDSCDCFYILLNLYRIEDYRVLDDLYLEQQFNHIEDAIFFNYNKFKNLYSLFDDTLRGIYKDFDY